MLICLLQKQTALKKNNLKQKYMYSPLVNCRRMVVNSWRNINVFITIPGQHQINNNNTTTKIVSVLTTAPLPQHPTPALITAPSTSTLFHKNPSPFPQPLNYSKQQQQQQHHRSTLAFDSAPRERSQSVDLKACHVRVQPPTPDAPRSWQSPF